ncbi:GTPase IMAP family member 8-like [Larimichthys crocea]|uniref:GTPase IMAP family member 8-like n=1 Tax=Larimichthys crocea TaxID=215358 RepID=UPI000F5E2141|nr:GTPase IMAP family member 8-like [Larimichthys crocea]
MEVSSVKELNAMLVGSTTSKKSVVGNIILGKVFVLKDVTPCCERRQGEVCGRKVTLAKAPGWLPGYELCNTPELFKTEAILSVTPGLHGFILVVNAKLPFKNVNKKATKEHLQYFFGDRVWDHTIVVFTHRGQLGYTIEDYIKREGAPLQSLLEACGNRYHVLCDDGTDNNKKVEELFEKIDAMVAEKRCYEIDIIQMQIAESKRKEVDKKAEELRMQTQQQRHNLKRLLTGPTLDLRVLMLGWVFSGKSATGNNLLSTKEFQSGERTVKALKQSGEVAGRQVVIVDTPGWWKFFPAKFNPSLLKSEILKGVSLCSPSPNVILLALPLDTSFTEEQRRVTEGNMKLLGPTVWRHVIVLFTYKDALGDKTIEHHIESEGRPLHWLIEKCGNRYHVFNNMSVADDQVTELLEKMEEMVAGNSSFYLSAHTDTDDPQHWEDRSDTSTESKDKNTAKEITEQLTIEWDRRNWEKQRIREGSMKIPPKMSAEGQESDRSEGEEEEMDHPHEDDHSKSFGLEEESEDDAGPGPLNRWKRLLEREWSRREWAMQHRHLYSPFWPAISEPDSDLLQKSREKVSKWLKTQHATSGYGTASSTSGTSKEEEEGGHGRARQLPMTPPAGGAPKRRKKDIS